MVHKKSRIATVHTTLCSLILDLRKMQILAFLSLGLLVNHLHRVRAHFSTD